MNRMLKIGLAAAALSGSTVSAVAAIIPISRDVEIEFTGTVVESAPDTLRVRGPDGTVTDFTGTLPDYPLNVGDSFTFNITAVLPTREFYDSVVPGGPTADGIYRIPIQDSQGGANPLVGYAADFSVSSPLRPTLNIGQSTNLRLGIVYDYYNDSYSIDPDSSFSSGAYAAPGYLFDAATGEYVLCGTQSTPACRGNVNNDPVIFRLESDADPSQISSTGILVNGTDAFGVGVFNLGFQGSWNLPIFGSNPVPVPAPGMLLLFSLVAGMIALRKKLSFKSRAPSSCVA